MFQNMDLINITDALPGGLQTETRPITNATIVMSHQTNHITNQHRVAYHELRPYGGFQTS
jgi:hypothetical protein